MFVRQDEYWVWNWDQERRMPAFGLILALQADVWPLSAWHRNADALQHSPNRHTAFVLAWRSLFTSHRLDIPIRPVSVYSIYSLAFLPRACSSSSLSLALQLWPPHKLSFVVYKKHNFSPLSFYWPLLCLSFSLYLCLFFDLLSHSYFVYLAFAVKKKKKKLKPSIMFSHFLFYLLLLYFFVICSFELKDKE